MATIALWVAAIFLASSGGSVRGSDRRWLAGSNAVERLDVRRRADDRGERPIPVGRRAEVDELDAVRLSGHGLEVLLDGLGRGQLSSAPMRKPKWASGWESARRPAPERRASAQIARHGRRQRGGRNTTGRDHSRGFRGLRTVRASSARRLRSPRAWPEALRSRTDRDRRTPTRPASAASLAFSCGPASAAAPRPGSFWPSRLPGGRVVGRGAASLCARASGRTRLARVSIGDRLRPMLRAQFLDVAPDRREDLQPLRGRRSCGGGRRRPVLGGIASRAWREPGLRAGTTGAVLLPAMRARRATAGFRCGLDACGRSHGGLDSAGLASAAGSTRTAAFTAGLDAQGRLHRRPREATVALTGFSARGAGALA